MNRVLRLYCARARDVPKCLCLLRRNVDFNDGLAGFSLGGGNEAEKRFKQFTLSSANLLGPRVCDLKNKHECEKIRRRRGPDIALASESS